MLILKKIQSQKSLHFVQLVFTDKVARKYKHEKYIYKETYIIHISRHQTTLYNQLVKLTQPVMHGIQLVWL